ncbi:MAG: KpsF/GutQ family sugar-phosphate isomerase [Opitutaceae bacterium]|jgi:arabinose-5-phosphate isomerase|nr:KpsF/GutQ family sugar-phosphate isomerase [Opitutaceae bacterium]
MKTAMTDAMIRKQAREVLKMEAEALEATARGLDAGFVAAARAIAAAKGRVVVVGLGKSGHVGRKIAATLASTGTPAFFVHAAEAFHGDLGMLARGDIALMLSFSGNSGDVNKLPPFLSRRKLTVISMTGNAASPLARLSDIHIAIRVEKEACPYNLAPTSSTTAMLAAGDALAICLMRMKGFKKEDFAVFHPGGALGRLLTCSVRDIMHGGADNPIVRENASVRDALFVMTERKSGAVSVAGPRGELRGFFTDGDLRRGLQKDASILSRSIGEVMTRRPTSIRDNLPAVEAARVFYRRKFANAPVVDAKGRVVGILDEKNMMEFVAMVEKA